MLSVKHAKLAIRILALCLVAAISFCFVTEVIPETEFVKESYESVEASSETVMKFSAATLSASLAISALPDDFATPLAENLADMNVYFIAILVVLFLEKLLILYGIKLAFSIAIPLACVAGILFVTIKQGAWKTLAIRLCAFGLAVAFVVPCSTHITKYVASDLTAYVENTISETESGADKLNQAMEGGTEEQTVFEKLSDLFQTAIRDISDLMLHFQNTIRRCMNSVAILILTNCIIPLLTFFFLKWILKESFQIALPIPTVRRLRNAEPESEAAVGE